MGNVSTNPCTPSCDRCGRLFNPYGVFRINDTGDNPFNLCVDCVSKELARYRKLGTPEEIDNLIMEASYCAGSLIADDAAHKSLGHRLHDCVRACLEKDPTHANDD